MKKPPYISHYLILKDLINDIDVRQYNDSIRYLTSRIENIKRDFVKYGLQFEETMKPTTYSYYKPYTLTNDKHNIQKAKELLKVYHTHQVKKFLDEVQESRN